MQIDMPWKCFRNFFSLLKELLTNRQNAFSRLKSTPDRAKKRLQFASLLMELNRGDLRSPNQSILHNLNKGS
jgi:hypothetical protein